MGVRVAFDQQLIRKLAELPRQHRQQIAAFLCRLRASRTEKRSRFILQKFDSQSFARDDQPHLIFQRLHLGHVFHRLLDLLFQLRHVVFFQVDSTSCTLRPAPLVFAFSAGIQEITANHLLRLLAGIQQPQDNEQRHHRSYEIGVRDFPRPAVMRGVPPSLFDDNDRRMWRGCGIRLFHRT